jgi:sugar phosphate isomerase/epimerase
MRELLKKIQVHVPFHQLRNDLLPRVVAEGINPEISFNHRDLELFGSADFTEAACRLAEAGLAVTFHAPFLDLRPGALDPKIREVSLERLRRVFALAPLFKPRSIVCHPSFDERYYVSVEKQWLARSLETWNRLAEELHGTETVIVLENVYEKDPRQIGLLLAGLDPSRVRFCFDTGHANAFGTASYEEWMEGLGGRLGEIHIHDNDGRSDQHLPIGEGNFPFQGFFDLLRRKRLKPILTIESHSDAGLRRMLANIETMKLLEGF